MKVPIFLKIYTLSHLEYSQMDVLTQVQMGIVTQAGLFPFLLIIYRSSLNLSPNCLAKDSYKPQPAQLQPSK